MAKTQIAVDFHLHPKQLEAYNSQATEILYGGAAGGGKSYYLRIAAIMWALRCPGAQIYLVRRSQPDLIANHLYGIGGFIDLLDTLSSQGFVRFKVKQNEYHFSNGSIIFLRHCATDSDLENFQGREIHVLLMDELTHFPEHHYTWLRGRVRLGGLQIPEAYKHLMPRIECGSNPGSRGHAWVKRTFVSPKAPMEIWQPEEVDFSRQYIPAKLTDNPTLTDNDPGYAKRLSGLGNEALIRALRDGDWDIVAGQAFDMWREDIHCVDSFDIPKDWLRFRCMDWGSAHPFCVGWFAVARETFGKIPKGSLVMYREWYGWSGKPNEGLKMTSADVADGVLYLEKPDERISYSIADTEIFSQKDGPTIAERMAEKGVHWERADKNRINGLAEVIRRLKGKGSHNNVKLPMDQWNDDEKPTLYFFNTYRDGVIRTLPTLVMDERRIEDIDQKQEDHPYDMVRYACMSAYRQIPKSGLFY